MPEHHHLKAESGSYRVEDQDVRLTITIVERVLKKNWLLIVLYAVITLAGLIYTYFTGSLLDTVVAIVVAGITFLIGLKMLKEINTVTKETR